MTAASPAFDSLTPPATPEMRPVTDAPAVLRFYGDLAEWWPLISPPEDYDEEAAFAATLLDSASIPVRERCSNWAAVAAATLCT